MNGLIENSIITPLVGISMDGLGVGVKPTIYMLV